MAISFEIRGAWATFGEDARNVDTPVVTVQGAWIEALGSSTLFGTPRITVQGAWLEAVGSSAGQAPGISCTPGPADNFTLAFTGQINHTDSRIDFLADNSVTRRVSLIPFNTTDHILEYQYEALLIRSSPFALPINTAFVCLLTIDNPTVTLRFNGATITTATVLGTLDDSASTLNLRNIQGILLNETAVVNWTLGELVLAKNLSSNQIIDLEIWLTCRWQGAGLTEDDRYCLIEL
jgi:hypothetical protein